MSMSWPYALAQILILDSFGFSKSESLKILGIGADQELNIDTSIRIAARDFNKVFDAAEIKLNDPLIGFRTGYEFRISNYAKTGNIYSYCKDLTEVLILNARYQPIAVDIGRISTVVETDDANSLSRYFLDYNIYCDDFHTIRHVFGLIFGAYGTAFRWLTWSSAYELKGVYFKQDKPDDTALFEKIYQCPVYFNQAYNRIEFFEDSMTAKLSTYDPVRKAQDMAKLDGLMARKEARDSFKKSLYFTIKQEIARGQTAFSSIAVSLGLPANRLRQKLKDTDIKYRFALDEVRQDLFKQKHVEGLGLSQIAQELAYNDQAAFNRAFKRWYGMSPGQFMAKNTNITKA